MKWAETGFGNCRTMLQGFLFSLSKVIGNCFGLSSLRSVIDLKNSIEPLNQSDEKSDYKLLGEDIARKYPAVRSAGKALLTVNAGTWMWHKHWSRNKPRLVLIVKSCGDKEAVLFNYFKTAGITSIKGITLNRSSNVTVNLWGSIRGSGTPEYPISCL